MTDAALLGWREAGILCYKIHTSCDFATSEGAKKKILFKRSSPTDAVVIVAFETTGTPEDFTGTVVSRLVPNIW